MPMVQSTETLPAADGVPLFVYTWTPSEHSASPRGIVQIVHGMSEHAGRYVRFASALVEAGFAVIAHDHRGHGRTAKAPEDLGHFADDGGWIAALGDVELVGRHARKRWPGCVLVRFGHSLGSTLAVHALHAFPGSVDAAILSGAIGVVGMMLPLAKVVPHAERFRQGKRGKSWLCDYLTFGDFNRAFRPPRTRFDWLSKDAQEVDAYINDPRCGFMVTNQFWCDALGGLSEAYKTANLAQIPKELPVRFIIGANDPVSKHKLTGASQLPPALSRLRAVGMSSVSERVWAEGRHELLNDTEKEQVTDDVIQWLHLHCSAKNGAMQA